LCTSQQHSGSAHGGHYHALIRDLLGEGGASAPEDQEVSDAGAQDTSSSHGTLSGWQKLVARSKDMDMPPVPANQDHVQAVQQDNCDSTSATRHGHLGHGAVVDYHDKPELLVRDVLRQWADLYSGKSLTADEIIREIFEQRGESWNRKYGRRFGKMVDFLASRKDMFTVSSQGYVSLVPDRMHDKGLPRGESQRDVAAGAGTHTHANNDYGNAHRDSSKDDTNRLNPGTVSENQAQGSGLGDVSHLQGQWFDFNDSVVKRISLKALEQQFEGPESAYMLFYRQKDFGIMAQHPDSRNPPTLPQHLQAEIGAYTARLSEERERYANRCNIFSAEVFLEIAVDRADDHGALRLANAKSCVTVEGDRRQTVLQFKQKVCERLLSTTSATSSTPTALPAPLVALLSNASKLCLHQLQPREAGLHVFPIFPADESAPAGSKIPDKCQLLAYNGQTVAGRPIKCGAHHCPLLLRVIFLPLPHDKDFICEGVPVVLTASSTMQQLREELCRRMGLEPGQHVDVFTMEKESDEDPQRPLRITADDHTELCKVPGLFDGMTITAEPWGTLARPPPSRAPQTQAQPHAHVTTHGDKPLAWEAFAWRNGRTRLVVRSSDGDLRSDKTVDTTVDVDKWNDMSHVKAYAIAALSISVPAHKVKLRIGQPGWDGAAGEGFSITDESLTVGDMQLDQNSVVVLDQTSQEHAQADAHEEMLLWFHVHARDCNSESPQWCERSEIVLSKLVSVGTAKERMLEALDIDEHADMWQIIRTNWAEEHMEALPDRCLCFCPAVCSHSFAPTLLQIHAPRTVLCWKSCIRVYMHI
jgi:hypothetical protein